jgi:1,4-alpha-glucan branching enzyme
MSGKTTEDFNDPLEAAVAVLRHPAPVAPGFAERTRQRAGHLRRRRQWLTGSTTLAAAVALVVVLTDRETVMPAGVTFALNAPSSTSVSLVGDFNDWDSEQTRLERGRDDEWTVTLDLPPGRYRFAYVTDDGTWLPDPKAPPTVDEFGEPTSVLTVPTE